MWKKKKRKTQRQCLNLAFNECEMYFFLYRRFFPQQHETESNVINKILNIKKLHLI